MKKTLLFTIALLFATITNAQTFIKDNITYIVTSTTANTVKITDYNTNGGTTVVIPENVTPNSSSKTSSKNNLASTTYTVTGIGFNAFRDKGLTSVIIPNTVVTIDNNAFYNNSISSVDLPNGLTVIGSFLFHQNNLTSIDIPDGVTTINPSAFSSNNISNISLPNSLTLIASGAFSGNNLTNVTIPENVTDIHISAFGGNPITCVVSEATTPPNINVGTGSDSFSNIGNIDLSVPTGTATAYINAGWTGFNSVTEGLTGTFVINNITYQINASPNNEVTVTDYNTAGGTVVNIPATVSSACTSFSVKNIGVNAFNGKNLTSVILPNGVINIGNSAFQNNNLTSITIPNSVTNIDIEAFRDNQLTNAILSDNLLSIGNYAFAINDLSSITIPDSVTSINDAAFAQNSNLNNLVIGNSVTSIGLYAFQNNNISSVTIPNSVTAIGASAFRNNNLTNLELGNGVSTIGDLAFGYNNLTSVVIPASVTLLEDSVFNNNPLTSVYSEATTAPATITNGSAANDTFYFRSNVHLYIPTNTTATYNAAGWTGFASVTEDASLSISNFKFEEDVKLITTSNELQVQTSNNLVLQSYTIYSISGAKSASGIEDRISIENLSNGIYILKLDFDKGTLIKKFLR
ncbi:MAG: leucine-rich repeat domain-containing protein [Polaribacter sp.]